MGATGKLNLILSFAAVAVLEESRDALISNAPHTHRDIEKPGEDENTRRKQNKPIELEFLRVGRSSSSGYATRRYIVVGRKEV